MGGEGVLEKYYLKHFSNTSKIGLQFSVCDFLFVNSVL
jgi:hypothetical protein